MRSSTCRAGKTNGNFETIFGIRDNVGETYEYTKFRSVHMGAPPHSGEMLQFCD